MHGRKLFFVGLVTYCTTAAITAIALFQFGSERADKAIIVLFLVPIIFPLLTIGLLPTLFIIGTVTGTPMVSFTYVFSMAKRNWMSLAGGLLLLSVVGAIGIAATNGF